MSAVAQESSYASQNKTADEHQTFIGGFVMIASQEAEQSFLELVAQGKLHDPRAPLN